MYVIVWLVRIWTHKNAEEKNKVFHGEEKNVLTRTKSGYCVNSPLVSQNYNYLPFYHLCFPPGRQKAWWIKNGSRLLIPSIVQMAFHFQQKKIKLHWFHLKKFISKKKNCDSYNKELLKTGGDPCKALNSANS